LNGSRFYDRLVRRRGLLRLAGQSAAVAALLEASRSLPAQSQTAPVLRVWDQRDLVPSWAELAPAIYQKIGAEIGANVQAEFLPDNESSRNQWATALARDDLPDVFRLATYDMTRFYGLGKLHPMMPELFARIATLHGPWMANAIPTVRFAGKAAAIPFFTRPWRLFYRKDIFDKAGIKVPVATMDEFKAAVKEVNNPKGNLFGVGFPYSEADQDGHMACLPWVFGGGLQNADNEFTIATPQNEAALAWYSSFYTEGMNPPDAVGWTPVGKNVAYLTGLAAVINNTGSVLAAMRTTEPRFKDVTVYGPWPKSPAGIVGDSLLAFANAISHNTRQPTLAAAFMERLMAPEHMTALLEALNGQGFPVQERMQTIDFFAKDPVLKQVAEEIVPVTHPSYYPGTPNAAYGEMTSISSPFLKDLLHRVVVDRRSPHDSLAEMAKAAVQVAAKYKR
jgi:ABC-type glycerol-3-phosphate transport system substrate-binding protein